MKLNLDTKITQIESILDTIKACRKNTLIWGAFTKDMQIRLSWNSNAIEGNTLSLEETLDVIEYDEVKSGHTYTEYQETKNLHSAIVRQMDFEKEKLIDLSWIKQCNSIIMDSFGEFRQKAVFVGTLAEVTYYPPEYSKVPGLMEQYVSKLNVDSVEEATDIGMRLQMIAKRHIEFELIHPYLDGNGRTGRMIMNQQLLNAGMLPAIMKDHSKYRQAFRRYDRNGSVEVMEYEIADGILKSYEVLMQFAKRTDER